MTASADAQRKKVVVVGGGVAGLEIATSLGRRWKRNPKAPTVSLIDRDSAHVWKPMLHTIAAGTRDISQQQTLYAAQALDAGFRYQPGEVQGLDRQAKKIRLAAVNAADGRQLVPAREVEYDALILAIGSEANDFGTPGVQEHCFKIDSRRLAMAFNREVRIRLLQCLEQDHDLSIAIVGGGATGVELAAELMQLSEIAGVYGAQSLSSRVSITLIEAGPRLLAAFPEDISLATKRRLESLGIKVLTGTGVTAATAKGFELGEQGSVEASLRIWAAGVKAPGVLAQLDGLETNRGNQLVVRPSLQTTVDPNVYAVGDCASLILPGADKPLAPTAQVAHQQAVHLIRHLPAALLRGTPIPDFHYRDFGALVTLADYDGFGSLGKFGFLKDVTIRGRLAQLSHAMLYRSHQARLYGFWRGGLVWLVDRLNTRIGSKIRLH